MSSTMETHILEMEEPSEPRKPMDWKELELHRFQLYAAGCRFRTLDGICRPGACHCEMANLRICEAVGIMRKSLEERCMKQMKMIDADDETCPMCQCCGKRPVAGYVAGLGGIYLGKLCAQCCRKQPINGRDEVGESYHRGARSARS